MAVYYTKDQFISVGSLDASGANTVVFAPPVPIDVKRIILITTVAQTTANATITVAVRDIDDTPSETIGTFVLPFTGSAIGDVLKVDLLRPVAQTTAVDGSLFNAASEGFVEVDPEEEIAFTSDGGGDAGTYSIWIEYEKQGFSGTRVSRVANVAFVNA